MGLGNETCIVLKYLTVKDKKKVIDRHFTDVTKYLTEVK